MTAPRPPRLYRYPGEVGDWQLERVLLGFGVNVFTLSSGDLRRHATGKQLAQLEDVSPPEAAPLTTSPGPKHPVRFCFLHEKFFPRRCDGPGCW